MDLGGLGREEEVVRAVDEAGEMIRSIFEKFLQTFTTQESKEGDIPKYMEQIQTMRNNDRNTLYVDFQDTVIYHEVMAEAVEREYYRFDTYVRKALQNVVRKDDPNYVRGLPFTDSASFCHSTSTPGLTLNLL
tara:strand:- start:211 stop:609 length:399 start_codon:yes stop_codon:yes gene_type:complete